MPSPRSLTALSSAALSGALGVAVKTDSTTRINRAVRRRLHPRRNPALRSVATAISVLAGPHVHPFEAGALAALIRLRRGEGGEAPIFASIGALALDNCVRMFVHQRRPPRAGKHHGRSRYGYPSGHVTAATAISVAVASELTENISPFERAVLWSAVVGIAVGVGWSRLYLDEHWIDDVAGGWLAGIALGLCATALPRVQAPRLWSESI